MNVHSFGNPNEKLTIGSLCSIADNVVFLLGGGHNYTGLLTFPIKVKFFNQDVEATTKGPIIVDDDVWIGSHCVVLSGVHIGKGAIIGAGSIVTKDVPAYSIVAGNPAKFIKYRFDKQIISELSTLNYSKLNRDKILKIKPLLCKPLDSNLVQEIKDAVN